MENKMSESLFLSLGQIIKIIAPNNGAIHDKIFFINYIDKKMVELVEKKTLSKTILNISEGFLTEESIETIQILYKPDEVGFAKQNNLLVGRMVTIEFGGEVPTIINGKISNLEEDRIEIESYPDKQYFYIDFEYKGIPRDLPIKSIKDFSLPSSKKDVEKEEDELVTDDLEGEENDEKKPEKISWGDMLDSSSDEEDDPVNVDASSEKEIDLDGDLIDIQDIEFMDEDLQEISEEVEVVEGEKIYDINDQITDLMDDLLASVPSSQRTPKFLRQLHIMLERYKELREEYSQFDDMGYFSDVKYKTADYKPVSKKLQSMKHPLYWALPVVETKKHIYDLIKESNENISLKDTAQFVTRVEELFNEFKSNSIPDEQNKYDYLYKNISFETYDKPNKLSNILKQTTTENNNVVVDNIGDFESESVGVIKVGKDKSRSELSSSRFIIDKMTKGLSKIKPSFHKTPGCPKSIPLSTQRTSITDDDMIFAKGVITLPYDVMQYSKIYDINNSLLSRVNYHNNQVHYSELLNNNTEVLLNDFTTPVNIFNNVVYHYKNANDYDSGTVNNVWDDMTNDIALNVKQLFKTLKEEMNDGVSFNRVVEYLKPYHIYTEDIVYSDYLSIKDFIEEQIKEYKKKKIDDIIKYNNYTKFIKNYKKVSFLDKYINIDSIKTLYNINEETDMQFFRKMYQLDDSKLMMGLLAKEIHNELKDENSNLTPEVLMELKKEIDSKSVDNKECENVVQKNISLSKKYYDLDDLLQDNNKNVVYDEKYDTTRYDIYEELAEEKNIKYPDLVDHLIKNVGVEKKTAEVDAQSMIDGYKSVQDGDYAVLEPNGYEMHYYKRKENKWMLDEEMSNKPMEEMGFCNLKDKCLKINKECVNAEGQEDEVKEMSIDELIKHYEETEKKNKEEINKKIADDIRKNQILAGMMKNEHKKRHLKYDIQKINIGKMLSNEDVIISPHEKLKTRILGEYDISSKMSHIILFVNTYCRSHLENKNESPHWYYCSESNVPLLPTFYHDLAIAFQNGTYTTALRDIEKDRGTSDGDNIVDKYSGYVIKKLQYDENEGYEESGFKRVTRAVMEEEEDIVLTSASLSGKTVQKKHMVFIKEMKKILKTLDTKLRINTTQQHEFIIKYMIMFMKKYVLSEKKYTAKIKKLKGKGKGKIPPYKKYKDEIKIFLLIGLYVIGIQLLTPHLDYAPTFEGCVMSFDGFPLEEGGNVGIVSYITCLFLKLKSSVRPWNVLPTARRSNFNEIKDKFVEKVMKFIKEKIIVNADILDKLDEKRDWLILNQELKSGRMDFDVKRWETFLPHLSKVSVADTRGVSGNFDRLLKESIAKGNLNQFSYMFSLMGKVINQSYLIQEDMERVVSNKELILNSLNDIPFLENACCNETKNCFNYFVDKEPLILQRNNEIKDMMKKYNTYMKLKKAPYLYNDENTKLVYPLVDSTYNEDTIYLSFIKYCKYNSGAILDDELQRLCITNESSFGMFDSLSEKIAIMKQEEGNYSSDSLIELMNVIARRNIIHQGFHTQHISPKIEFENKLNEENYTFKNVTTNVGEIIDKEVMESLKLVMDRFNLTYTEEVDNDIKDLLIVLNDKNKTMINKLSSYIKKTKAKKNKLIEFIKTIDEFKLHKGADHVTETDETNMYSINFLKKCLKTSIQQFPQLILGKINFDTLADIHNMTWNLSERHNEKLRKQAFDELGKFNQFSEDKEVESVLNQLVKKNRIIYDFSTFIPVYADNVENSVVKKSILNTTISKTLYKHLLLQVLLSYVDVEVITKVNKPFVNPDIEENVFEETNETLMDKMSDIMTLILDVFHYQKSAINFSMEEIQNNVLNIKEMEKTGVVERLKNMSKEDRKSEDYMKNLRLGDWNLGQTKSLYIYDPSQYDKEVHTEEKEREIRSGIRNKETRNGGTMDSFQEDIAVEEMMKDSETNRLVEQEMMQDMMGMGEDDDYGDMDGDEMF